MSERNPSKKDEFVRDLYETLYEEKSFEAVPEFYAPEAVRHGGLRGAVEGPDAMQEYLHAALGGLSDIEVTELRWLADDNVIAYDFEMAATHSGEMMGVPPTGNQIEMENTVWFRFEDGLVTDEWPRTDMLGLLTGVGVVELPF